MQLRGLGELMAFAALGGEPGHSFHILVNYLARALDEPHLWLGVIEGSPPTLTLYSSGDPTALGIRPERVTVQWLQPDWLRWIALGKGTTPLWVGPTGSRKGGPWHPLPIRGELPHDHFSDEIPPCPGALSGGGSCALSGALLEDMAGGHRACGQCEFRHIVGLLGVEGESAADRMTPLEAVVPSLGAILVNLGLKEALDFEARFRDEVVLNLPLGVVAIDARGVVLAWNRAAEAILGITREEAQAQPMGRLAPRRPWHDALIRCLERGVAEERVEHQVTRPDGTSCPVEVSTAPLRDAEGMVRGALATLIDVSSFRIMEERIRQLDRLAALGRFASSVAHEIRNPLTGIATGVQFLSRGFPEGDERHESVSFILREVTRLNTIIQDLFTASKPRELHLARVKVQEIVGRTLRALKPAPEEAGVTIILEAADRWPTVTADADQLQQVLLNLIQNAVQATPAGGRVTVRARTEAGGHSIEIEDTGSGIAAEHLPRIFDPFYHDAPEGNRARPLRRACYRAASPGRPRCPQRARAWHHVPDRASSGPRLRASIHGQSFDSHHRRRRDDPVLPVPGPGGRRLSGRDRRFGTGGAQGAGEGGGRPRPPGHPAARPGRDRRAAANSRAVARIDRDHAHGRAGPRDGRSGDAIRRPRLPHEGKTDSRRAPPGPGTRDRGAPAGAGSAAPSPGEDPEVLPRFRQEREPGDAEGVRHRRPGGGQRFHERADRGGKRDRQGADRALDPRPLGATGPADARGELRRHPARAPRVGALWPRKGRLHRRAPAEAGTSGARERRDALPRRGRRDEPDHPGQAPPGSRANDVQARRRDQGHHGERPGDLGDESEPRNDGPGAALSRGPLLPAEGRSDPGSGAARAAGGHSPARPPLPGAIQPNLQQVLPQPSTPRRSASSCRILGRGTSGSFGISSSGSCS